MAFKPGSGGAASSLPCRNSSFRARTESRARSTFLPPKSAPNIRTSPRPAIRASGSFAFLSDISGID